jgi:hypothetical protein
MKSVIRTNLITGTRRGLTRFLKFVMCVGRSLEGFGLKFDQQKSPSTQRRRASGSFSDRAFIRSMAKNFFHIIGGRIFQ